MRAHSHRYAQYFRLSLHLCNEAPAPEKLSTGTMCAYFWRSVAPAPSAARRPIGVWIRPPCRAGSRCWSRRWRPRSSTAGATASYTGTKGKVTHCQVGVSLEIATASQHAPIDFDHSPPPSPLALERRDEGDFGLCSGWCRWNASSSKSLSRLCCATGCAAELVFLYAAKVNSSQSHAKRTLYANSSAGARCVPQGKTQAAADVNEFQKTHGCSRCRIMADPRLHHDDIDSRRHGGSGARRPVRGDPPERRVAA